MPSEDYYKTSAFPEDYMGYNGNDVWRYILDHIGLKMRQGKDEYNTDDWKANFNKAVSGLHTMVLAQVLRGV